MCIKIYDAFAAGYRPCFLEKKPLDVGTGHGRVESAASGKARLKL